MSGTSLFTWNGEKEEGLLHNLCRRLVVVTFSLLIRQQQLHTVQRPTTRHGLLRRVVAADFEVLTHGKRRRRKSSRSVRLPTYVRCLLRGLLGKNQISSSLYSYDVEFAAATASGALCVCGFPSPFASASLLHVEKINPEYFFMR